jgi:hypothetical protein
MDLARQHVRQGFVDHSMPLQPAAPGKCLRLDPDLEVPGAASRAFVARVPGAVIVHRHLGCGESRLQSRPDPVN